MLITDYSSVCWDILYQDKPTLFYQFDLDKYNEAHGSYIDMKTELFGDRAETEEELMELLEETVLNDFHLKPEYELKRHEYFSSKIISTVVISAKKSKKSYSILITRFCRPMP